MGYGQGIRTPEEVVPRKRIPLLALLLLPLLAVAHPGPDLRLSLNFHDRADPNPRQVQIAAEVAGLALSFLVSWTQSRQGG
jgi:hypothetical protein